MDTAELIKRLELIAEDARSYSGCNHEDALQDGLQDVQKQLEQLIQEMQQ